MNNEETKTVFKVTKEGVKECVVPREMTVEEETAKYAKATKILTDFYSQADTKRTHDLALSWWRNITANRRKEIFTGQKYSEILWHLKGIYEANRNARPTIAEITFALNKAWYREGFEEPSYIHPSDELEPLVVYLGGNAATAPIVTTSSIGRIICNIKLLGVPVFTVSRCRSKGTTERRIRLNVTFDVFLEVVDSYIV